MRQIQVDEQAYRIARDLARKQQVSVSDVVSELLRKSTPAPGDPSAIVGCMSSHADLLDRVVEAAMAERGQRPLRANDG